MASLGEPLGLSRTACWVTSRLAIRDALKKKAVRYGQLQEPYIIVVNCLGEMCDESEIDDGIYGKDGLWTSLSSQTLTRVTARFLRSITCSPGPCLAHSSGCFTTPMRRAPTLASCASCLPQDLMRPVSRDLREYIRGCFSDWTNYGQIDRGPQAIT